MMFFKSKSSNVRYGNNEKKIHWLGLKPLLVLLCAGFLYYAYINWQSWLEKLDHQPINAFALLGNPEFTSEQDVREMILGMGELKGFFGQDVESIHQQISKMSWVKGAVVRKIWPNRLSILVADYHPIAVWNDTEFLSSDGNIFSLPTEKLKNADLPRLFGPDYQSDVVLNAWNRLYKELQSKGLRLKSVLIDERGSWQIVLDNDVILKLGRGEWKAKIDRFMTIYPQIEVPEGKRLSYVDLRYTVGAAVGMTDNHSATSTQ